MDMIPRNCGNWQPADRTRRACYGAEMTSGGTVLGDIPEHHLAMECRCGHAELMPVRILLERLGGDTDLRIVQRCSRCRQRGAVELRIIYMGGSWVAMTGAAAR